ncbi:iron ABC transporter permease [Paenibacillus sp. TRM 82003]|nr:iron ABC transporter permease [Paenibacillus sp. TRM 82003]
MISFRLERKTVRWIAVLTPLLLLCMLASLSLGDMRIPFDRALRAIVGVGEADEVLVVFTLRLPRVLIGFLVGASLAVSGALLQSVTRNALAAPDIVGINGGASVAAVVFLTYLVQDVSVLWLPVFAMAGAFGAAAVVYGASWKRGAGVSSLRLVLVGVGVASLMSALTTLMVLFSPMHTAAQAYVWLTGTIYGATWTQAMTLLPWTLLFLVLAFAGARHANALMLGDDTARGIGSRVQWRRLQLIGVGVALAGSAVSIGGMIGFVGLLAPHMARRLAGPTAGAVLPISALLGGLIVVVADLAARTVFLPLDLPVGVLTAGVGAPFFIYLLYRTRASS